MINLQFAVIILQFAVINLQFAVIGLQFAVINLQFAVIDLQNFGLLWNDLQPFIMTNQRSLDSVRTDYRTDLLTDFWLGNEFQWIELDRVLFG